METLQALTLGSWPESSLSAAVQPRARQAAKTQVAGASQHRLHCSHTNSGWVKQRRKKTALLQRGGTHAALGAAAAPQKEKDRSATTAVDFLARG